MSLDPAMAALAARTAAAWRAEQDQRPDALPQHCSECGRASGHAYGCSWASVVVCECTADVPCLRHVVTVSDRLLASPAAMAADLASIPGEIDMAGPHDDAQRPDALPLVTAHTAHILIPALQALRPELAHFAGAAHRDPIALAVVQEWQIDREASEDVLRERGRARRGGGR